MATLDLVGLKGRDQRYPSQLSGGQQQRVALARSLALEPRLILLDEPLSNLDAKLREEMRVELKRLIKKVGISALYVTHDQEEAFTISDAVVVMDSGKILQYGAPDEIYNRPLHAFVASFIGHSTLVDGKVVRIDGKDCVVNVPGFNGANLLSPLVKGLALGDSCKVVIRTTEVKLNNEKFPEGADNVSSALGIALVVLTLFSLLVTFSITRPLSRLRSAVHDLGQTTYQQNSLAQLANRRDEFGVLANDFNRMGARLQSLIGSQRQLLRDVSHELRSPLARLRIALALAERANPEEREKLWPRLTRECDRLEALISEILVLASVDADNASAEEVDLNALLNTLQKDAQLGSPEQNVRLEAEPQLNLKGWPTMIERAVDNLLRNAQRFNPVGHRSKCRRCVRATGLWSACAITAPG